MSMKRGYPGGDKGRKGSAVGPDYPESHYKNPWNVGIDEEYGSDEHKTLKSPTSTPAGMHVEKLHDDYDEYWKKGK